MIILHIFHLSKLATVLVTVLATGSKHLVFIYNTILVQEIVWWAPLEIPWKALECIVLMAQSGDFGVESIYHEKTGKITYTLTRSRPAYKSLA